MSSGFPFCRYYLDGVAQEPLDNKPSDWRTYPFVIEIVQEAAAKTPANAESDFQDAVEGVMNRLSANWQLANNCEISGFRPGKVTLVQAPFGPALVLPIAFDVKTVIQ